MVYFGSDPQQKAKKIGYVFKSVPRVHNTCCSKIFKTVLLQRTEYLKRSQPVLKNTSEMYCPSPSKNPDLDTEHGFELITGM
jgi:hypothetical protein